MRRNECEYDKTYYFWPSSSSLRRLSIAKPLSLLLSAKQTKPSSDELALQRQRPFVSVQKTPLSHTSHAGPKTKLNQTCPSRPRFTALVKDHPPPCPPSIVP